MTTAGDWARRLGGIPVGRIRLDPPPGKATEQFVVDSAALCEYIDGTAVDLAADNWECTLNGVLFARLYYESPTLKKLGAAVGPRILFRLRRNVLRRCDVAYISAAKLARWPGRDTEEIVPFGPDVAVTYLRAENTDAEMRLARADWFAGGARLVWVVRPKERIVHVSTAPDAVRVHREGETLAGGDVLPGFAMPVAELFAEWDRNNRNANGAEM